MRQMRLNLLGGFDLWREGRSLATLLPPRLQNFLAYLATHRDRAHSRAQLAGLFWGEASEARARSSLRTALHALRKTLDLPGEKSCLISDAKAVQFNTATDYWLDIAQFETLLSQASKLSGEAQLRCRLEALSLYRGDFMAGCYEEWCLLERERYQALCLGLLNDLSDHYRRLGNYRRAVEYAQRALALNPLQEETHRELIYLYYLSGDRNAALAQYRTCREALQQQLGVEPLPETQALYQQIAKQTAQMHRRLELSPEERTRFLLAHYGELRIPFVGRQEELKRLQLAWELATSENGSYILIQGEAGIGKTRLVRELCRRVVRDEQAVLIGRSTEWEGSQPYEPLVEALRSRPERFQHATAGLEPVWQATLSALMPELGRLGDHSGEPREADLFEALNRLLMALCQQEPTLLFLDDLHWADPRTLAYLAQLARRVGQMRLLFIATYRDEHLTKESPLQMFLEALSREERAQPLGLEPLTLPLSTELVGKMLLLSAQGDALGRHLYVRCEGNPFFIIETVKNLIASGGLSLNAAGTWDVQPEAFDPFIPTSVRAVIAPRVAHLSLTARHLLELSAVIGDEPETKLLVEISRQPEAVILEGLTEIHAFQLLMPMKSGYRFAHGLIHETIYQSIPPADRGHLHRLVAEALEWRCKQGEVVAVESLAHHFHRAEVWHKALPYELQAGARAQSLHAPKVALALYALAQESAERLQNENLGLPSLAASRYTIALGQTACFHLLGRRQEEGEAVRELLSCAEKLHEDRALVQARFWEFEWSFASGRTSKALILAQKALALAISMVEPSLLATAYTNLGRAHWSRAQFEQAFAAYGEAQRLLATRGDRAGVARTANDVGVLYKSLGRYDLALQHYRKAYRLCRQQGEDEEVIRPLLNQGNLYLEVGQYRRALARFCRSYRLSRRLGHVIWALSALANLGEAHGQLGDSRRALSILRRAARRSRIEWPVRGEATIQAQIGGIYYAKGCSQQALEHFLAALRLSAAAPEHMPMIHLTLEMLARTSLAYVALGRSREALKVLKRAWTLAEQESPGELLPLLHFSHYKALLSAHRENEALNALRCAQQKLIERSQKIADPPMRRSFLGNVALHREISAEWEARCGHTSR